MTRDGRRRALVVAPLLVILAAALVLAFAGIPDFGDYHGFYGSAVTHVAVAQRHVGNIVAGVVFDYRGVDTLGEEFILFAASTGVAMLLRTSSRDERKRPYDVVLHDLTRVSGTLLAPVLFFVGLWVVAFGYVTPGGGFQGGVVLSGAVLLAWAGASYRDLRALTPTGLVDAVEALGVGSYVAIGLAALVVGGYFLDNVLPLGAVDSLAGSGTIALLNGATGLAVAAANVLICTEFLKQYVATVPGREDA